MSVQTAAQRPRRERLAGRPGIYVRERADGRQQLEVNWQENGRTRWRLLEPGTTPAASLRATRAPESELAMGKVKTFYTPEQVDRGLAALAAPRRISTRSSTLPRRDRQADPVPARCPPVEDDARRQLLPGPRGAPTGDQTAPHPRDRRALWRTARPEAQAARQGRPRARPAHARPGGQRAQAGRHLSRNRRRQSPDPARTAKRDPRQREPRHGPAMGRLGQLAGQAPAIDATAIEEPDDVLELATDTDTADS